MAGEILDLYAYVQRKKIASNEAFLFDIYSFLCTNWLQLPNKVYFWRPSLLLYVVVFNSKQSVLDFDKNNHVTAKIAYSII